MFFRNFAYTCTCKRTNVRTVTWFPLTPDLDMSVKNSQKVHGKNTMPLKKQPLDDGIPVNTKFPIDLFTRITNYQKACGMSTSQEAIRIGMTLFLTKNGF